jgi:hypothetical protein
MEVLSPKLSDQDSKQILNHSEKKFPLLAVLYDTFDGYNPLNRRIEGYSQKTRVQARKWRARTGHLVHVALLVEGVSSQSLPIAIFGAATLASTVYCDFIRYSPNFHQFTRRVHRLYPFIPKLG